MMRILFVVALGGIEYGSLITWDDAKVVVVNAVPLQSVMTNGLLLEFIGIFHICQMKYSMQSTI